MVEVPKSLSANSIPGDMRRFGAGIDRSELTPDQLAWKGRVSQAFDRASDRYDQYAHVQRQVANGLSHWLVECLQGGSTKNDFEVGSALEIGCGTGFFTSLLVETFPLTHWTVTDVSPAMVESVEKRLTGNSKLKFQVADGEYLELPKTFDLICSNLSFQWFHDLPAALPRLMQHLNPGGWLVFATLDSNNFSKVYARYPFLKPSPCSTDSLQVSLRVLEDASSIQRVHRETIMRSFPDLREFLVSLKRIGAGTPAKEFNRRKSELLAALRQSRDAQVDEEVDYRLLFVAAQKPPTEP